MNRMLSVLVTGATGKQGGAVADALLSKGHVVRVLTRRPDSPAAAALRQRGAEIAIGSFDDEASLRRAMEGQDSVFAVSTFLESGVEAEVKQGRALVDAAKAAGIGHFVYTSVGSADQATGIPHFDSKFAVEQYLKEQGVPHTILAPVYFFENLFFPQSLAALNNGVYAAPLPAGRKLAQIAVTDIGAFGALALSRRDAFLGRRIDLASDDLTGEEQAAALSRVLGREISYYEIPLAAIKAQSEELAIMYDWFNRVGYSVDTAALRRDYPEVGWHTFEGWAKKQDLAALGVTGKKD
ncbi:MAG: NmrA/HSCARG family protein [Polyangia bacterium]